MKLELGPIVGHVGPRDARIWVRADEPADLRCRLFEDQAKTRPVGNPWPLVTTAAAGGTGVATPIGLAPDTRFFYDVQTPDGASLVPAGRGPLAFRTAPPEDLAAGLSFAFGSCNKPLVHTFARRHRVWKQLGDRLRDADAEALRLLILCGDQIYADKAYDKLRKKGHDDPAQVLEAYRDEYQKQWAGEEIQQVMGNLPTYMVWDDHEIANGWGSHKRDATAQNRRNIFKGATEVYREFQQSHGPSGAAGKHHYGFRHGRTGFYVLDLRGRRDVTRKTDPLMGAPQWRDFKDWVEANEAELSCLFLVSSVPLAHAPSFVSKHIPKSDLRDQWNSRKNQPEQRRMLRLLFDLSNRRDIPVVILGGDVHVGTFVCIRSSRAEHARQPRIYQLTSSPISNSTSKLVSKLMVGVDKTRRIDDWAVARMLKIRTERNFGVVHVDYPVPGKATIHFEIHEEDRQPTPLPLGSF